ncbi:MAG: flagellar basal-body rod protein FlgG [Pirellulaceae bacterium]|jgi:flagellar basal-body rod protein FlgG
MSVQTLYTAATGMSALETKLDVIANNLANINTVGFKRDRANFEDLFYRNEVVPGSIDDIGNPTAVGTRVGLGTRVSSTQTNFAQGAFELTGGDLDLAIEGKGFFTVTDPSTGTPLYTRAGNFSVNANNELVLGSAQTGRVLDPPVVLPTDVTGIVINPNGQVLVKQQGAPTLTQLAQIQVAVFANPEGLQKLGENLYGETSASSTPILGNPGQNGVGVIRQGALESSNVEPVKELIDLITTQRSFELNSQAVQAGDQMLQLIANLRRG